MLLPVTHRPSTVSAGAHSLTSAVAVCIGSVSLSAQPSIAPHASMYAAHAPSAPLHGSERVQRCAAAVMTCDSKHCWLPGAQRDTYIYVMPIGMPIGSIAATPARSAPGSQQSQRPCSMWVRAQCVRLGKGRCRLFGVRALKLHRAYEQQVQPALAVLGGALLERRIPAVQCVALVSVHWRLSKKRVALHRTTPLDLRVHCTDGSTVLPER